MTTEIIEATTTKHATIARQINLRTAQNCASCHFMGGWADDAFCRKYQIEVRVKQVCDEWRADGVTSPPPSSLS